MIDGLVLPVHQLYMDKYLISSEFSKVIAMNKNETLKWIHNQEDNLIVVDERMKDTKGCTRGIYGIFINDGSTEECVYVGKTDNFYSRMFKGEGHICRMRRRTHFIEELNNITKPKRVIFKILEEVPFIYDNYYKDLQRLSSVENYFINKYQNMNQCLNQVPEGTKITEKEWEEAKLEYEKNKN